MNGKVQAMCVHLFIAQPADGVHPHSLSEAEVHLLHGQTSMLLRSVEEARVGWFHFYQISGASRSVRAECRLVVVTAWEEEEMGTWLNECKVSC